MEINDHLLPIIKRCLGCVSVVSRWMTQAIQTIFLKKSIFICKFEKFCVPLQPQKCGHGSTQVWALVHRHEKTHQTNNYIFNNITHNGKEKKSLHLR